MQLPSNFSPSVFPPSPSRARVPIVGNRSLKGLEQLGRIRIPVRGRLLQALHDDCLQVGRQWSSQLLRRRFWLGVQVMSADLDDGCPFERVHPGKQVVSDAAECIEIAAPVDLLRGPKSPRATGTSAYR